MHGFNQGISTVHDLCSSHKYSAIFVQEHWLFPHNIDSLFGVSDEYSGYGVSAMVDKINSGVFMEGHLVVLLYCYTKISRRL